MTLPTTALAEFVASLTLSNIPMRTAKRTMQHTLEVIAGVATGCAVPEAVSVRSLMPGSTAGWAGTVAMFSHAAEWDPIHGNTAICAGAVTIPAVLGVARAQKVDGPTAIAAIVAGYETTIRIGDALGSARLLAQGWWPTAVCGGAGAAAAAAKAMQLDQSETRNAIAIALVHAGGLATGGPEAPEARNLLCANTARMGVEAAVAAASGISGPAEPLTGDRGFLRAFGIEPEPGLLLEHMGKRWKIDETALKAFPCALQAQTALDGLSSILRDNGLSAGDVRAIEIGLPEPMRRIVDRPDPPCSRFAAAASLQFLAAAMVVDGAIRPDRLDAAQRADPAVVDLATRVAVAHDPDLDARYPDCWPARVSVRTDREVHQTRVDVAPGHPDRPIDIEVTRAKFRAIVPKDAESLEPQVLDLDRLDSVGLLAEAIDRLMPD